VHAEIQRAHDQRIDVDDAGRILGSPHGEIDFPKTGGDLNPASPRCGNASSFERELHPRGRHAADQIDVPRGDPAQIDRVDSFVVEETVVSAEVRENIIIAPRTAQQSIDAGTADDKVMSPAPAQRVVAATRVEAVVSNST